MSTDRRLEWRFSAGRGGGGAQEGLANLFPFVGVRKKVVFYIERTTGARGDLAPAPVTLASNVAPWWDPALEGRFTLPSGAQEGEKKKKAT